MKAGISYNVFNGEEHLLASLAQVRPFAEHINLVVQYTSNVGLPCSPELPDVIAKARAEGLVDLVHEFVPDLAETSRQLELAKRQIGLDHAARAGCTHFMTMDCDEYYVPAEFAAARAFIIETGVRTTAVATYLHVRRPIWRSALPDTTCCAFLTAIRPGSRLEFKAPYPVEVDPKRRLHGDDPSFHFFAADAIAMRHMNLVRQNLESKLTNSVNAANMQFMAAVRSAVETWRPGTPLHFPRKPPLDIIEVPDLFGIDARFR